RSWRTATAPAWRLRNSTGCAASPSPASAPASTRIRWKTRPRSPLPPCASRLRDSRRRPRCCSAVFPRRRWRYTSACSRTDAEASVDFVLDDLQGEHIRALLRLHLASAQQHSPPESVHALDVDGLRRPGVAFWSCWREGELLGCCALKELDRGHGEIKSMRTAPQHERQGIG